MKMKMKASTAVFTTVAMFVSVLALSAGSAGAASTGGWCNGKRATHNTTITTNANATMYRGSAGNDVIIATSRTSHPGGITVWGNGGNDTICIVGHEGTVFGGAGNDTIIGGPYLDSLHGQGGHDLIKGQGGNDIMSGGWGKDKLYGGWGNDQMDGGSGWDQLFGYSGTDTCRNAERKSSCER